MHPRFEMEFESISSHVNCSARFATDCLLEDYVDGTRSGEHNSSNDADPSGQRAHECDGCEDKSEQDGDSSEKIIKLLHPTTCKHRVPVVFHEPHVERGFRPLGKPWSYYILSVFQLHNESMNVWTHLLAFCLLVFKLVRFGAEIDFLGDPYSWPMLSGLITSLALYGCSTAAHCLQSKSELIHYTAFMFDYAGIGLYGLGSVIMHLEYSSDNGFYDAVKPFFIPLGSVVGFLICLCCCISKTIYSRPYPFLRKVWQMTPVGGIYVILISPIVHRLFLCYLFDQDCNDSIPYHVYQMIWFASSAFFFASQFLQKLKPGLCDHFFHSHQLFHVSIMFCTLRQVDAVFIDFQTRTEMIRSRPPPTFSSSFSPVILVCLAELICICVFNEITKIKLARESRNIECKKSE